MAIAALVLSAASSGACSAREVSGNSQLPAVDALPRLQITPGAVDTSVTQGNIDRTICVAGYSRSMRPPLSYTEPLKQRLMAEYGYRGRRLGALELDHLVSIELAGSPADPRNLWPEPHQVVGGWGSSVKDHLEDVLHRMVCAREIPLRDAQQDIATNWIDAYRKYVGPHPQRQRRFRERLYR